MPIEIKEYNIYMQPLEGEQREIHLRPGETLTIQVEEIPLTLPVGPRQMLRRFVTRNGDLARKAMSDPDADINFYTTTKRARWDLYPELKDYPDVVLAANINVDLGTDTNRTIEDDTEKEAFARYIIRSIRRAEIDLRILANT